MTLQSVATRLAAVPERVIEALPSLPASRWRPRRSWLAGDIIAAIGLGLAVGIAIGPLLQGRASGVEQADSAPGRGSRALHVGRHDPCSGVHLRPHAFLAIQQELIPVGRAGKIEESTLIGHA